MKKTLHRANERGTADHGWLKAKHSFGFASYYNPERMNFGLLRVINDDIVQPTRGFGTHPHRDMEIITIPQGGAVSHEDSQGNKGTITKGEVQVMSAGTGVLHSEFNHSKDTPLSLFQIWIEPKRTSVEPRYGQQKFQYQDKKNEWTQLVSPIDLPKEEGLKIHQDAFINATKITKGQELTYQLKGQNTGAYVLLSEGEVEIGAQTLISRDAMEITATKDFKIKSLVDSEVIVIEVTLT